VAAPTSADVPVSSSMKDGVGYPKVHAYSHMQLT